MTSIIDVWSSYAMFAMISLIRPFPLFVQIWPDTRCWGTHSLQCHWHLHCPADNPKYRQGTKLSRSNLTPPAPDLFGYQTINKAQLGHNHGRYD